MVIVKFMSYHHGYIIREQIRLYNLQLCWCVHSEMSDERKIKKINPLPTGNSALHVG